MATFHRHCGIDYSGAKTAHDRLPGLRVFLSKDLGKPQEVGKPSCLPRHWSRAGLAAWLIDLLGDAVPTLVGIDHAFSFPETYFKEQRLSGDWTSFLRDFQSRCPADEPGRRVRDLAWDPDRRSKWGDAKDRRIVDCRTGGKSVFHFNVPGSVAHSTHAGLPWLLRIREARPEVHFWPFDGWLPPAGRSVIAEVYPRLWNHLPRLPGMSGDQHDAWCVADRLRHADREGGLKDWFNPSLSEADSARVLREGWMLGVPSDKRDSGQ
jgi:hypothetical protein